MLENTATAQLLSQYGYLAILAGTMLEGETVVLVAGFLAHQGYLSLPWIMVFAFMGSSISDQGLFFLFRIKGKKYLQRFPRLGARVHTFSEAMRQRPKSLIAMALFFRFFYGFRNIAPVFLGLSTLPTPLFVALNLLGAAAWAALFSFGGYYFAKALQALLGTFVRYEVAAILLLLCIGAGYGWYRRRKHLREVALASREARQDGTAPEPAARQLQSKEPLS